MGLPAKLVESMYNKARYDVVDSCNALDLPSPLEVLVDGTPEFAAFKTALLNNDHCEIGRIYSDLFDRYYDQDIYDRSENLAEPDYE